MATGRIAPRTTTVHEFSLGAEWESRPVSVSAHIDHASGRVGLQVADSKVAWGDPDDPGVLISLGELLTELGRAQLKAKTAAPE